MPSVSIVTLIARFAGLDTDARLLRQASAHGKCSFGHEAGAGRKPRSYSSSSVNAAELLAAAVPPLERLFSPYLELLRELVHPTFRWHSADHTKTPLNVSQRAEFLRAAAARRAAQDAKRKPGKSGGERDGGGPGSARRIRRVDST